MKHKMSSPIIPQSNRLVDKTVHTCKNIFTKSSEGGDDTYLGLLEYRNTPLDSYTAPVQLLISCQLHSTLPCTEKHLLKQVVLANKYLLNRKDAQSRQKLQYDKHAKPQPTLHSDDTVAYQKQADSR